MSHSFVAMVTFHIPPIAPSSGWWSFFFSSTRPAHTQSLLFCCLHLFLSFLFFLLLLLLVCLLENGEGWTPDDGKLIQPVADGDVWVEPEWFRPPSVTFPSSLLKCGSQNNTFVSESLPTLSLSLNTNYIIKVSNAIRVTDMSALVRQCCAKPLSKRGSATFFSATSSHLCLCSLSTRWHVVFF